MLAFKRIGGEKVRKGNYWNFSTGERIHLEKGGILPGDASVTYLKFHPAMFLIVGPLLGLAYVIFLPVIGIAMVIWIIGGKVFGGVLQGIWKAAVFSWQPCEAYLAGRKGKVKKVGKSNEEVDEDKK